MIVSPTNAPMVIAIWIDRPVTYMEYAAARVTPCVLIVETNRGPKRAR